MGRAGLPCPGNSDVHLLGYCEGIIDFDAKVTDGAFEFRMPKQQQVVSLVMV